MEGFSMGELGVLLKEWQQSIGMVVLLLFLDGKFKRLVAALRYHRHTKAGIPVDGNGKELFQDGKI